jgi:hypothetical protein
MKQLELDVLQKGNMHNIDDIYNFVHSGRAVFTLVGTSARFTYQLNQAEDKPGELYFLRLRSGQTYIYVGTIYLVKGAIPPKLRLTKASKMKIDDQPVKAFNWFYARLNARYSLKPMEFWHDGSCGRCRRRLTTPRSIAIGLGPHCAGLIK